MFDLSSCKMSGGGDNSGYVIVEDVSFVTPETGKQTSKRTSYISPNGLMVDNGDSIMLVARKGGKAVSYSLIKADKKAQDTNDIVVLIVDGLLGYDCDANGDCKDRLGSVKPTEEFQTIAGLKARKVELKDEKSSTKGWFTKDSADLTAAEEVRKNFLADLLRAGGKKVNRINSRTDQYGALVMDEISIGKMNFTTKFVSIEKREMPAAFFEIPKGYEIEAIKAP